MTKATPGHFPDHMNQTEARICNKLISAIFRAGHSIRVYDGEEFSTDWTRDRATVQRETAATDTTNYVVGTFNDAQGKIVRIGSYFLVHGNDEDVLSDISGANEYHLQYLDQLSKAVA